jgi:site-specific recombinase XerD
MTMSSRAERSKRIIFDDKLEETANDENLKLLQKYKIDMEIRELSPKSIYNYERDLLQWFSYLNKNQFNLSVKEATEDDIEEFIYFCKTQGNNTERIKRRISSIAAFYKFLRRKKIVKENPMEFIVRPKKGLPVEKKVFLTKEQVQQARKWLKDNNDIQLEVYFELSLATMARATAISSIKWEQIDFDNMVIVDVLEKEGYIVNLFFDENVRDLLLKLKQMRENNGIENKYLFITKYGGQYNNVNSTTLDSWAKKIGEAIGEPELSPHDFRRSGATLRSEAGMPLEQISMLLNHKGTDVTRLYVKENTAKIGEEFRKYKI